MNLSYTTLLPWSYSKWKSLRDCHLKFHLKYIEKLKGEYIEAIETTIGKAAHHVLEHVIAGQSYESALASSRAEYATKLDFEKEIEQGLGAQLLSFQSRFEAFKRLHRVRTIYQEKKIAVTEDFRPTTFFGQDAFYRGVVDLCLYLENEDCVIIDHKTGAPAEMGLKNFQGQLDVYKILTHYGIKSVKGVATGVHFIRDAEIKIGNRSSKEDVEGSIKNSLLFSIQLEVDALNEAEVIKKKPGHYCKYCDYKVDCKAGNLKKYEGQPINVYRIEKSD